MDISQNFVAFSDIMNFNPIPTRWGRNQPSHFISRDQVG